MKFLSDIISHNMEEEINKNIENIENDGFLVITYNGEMIVKSRIHPWTAKHSGYKLQEIAIKKLQKEIGGEYKKDVFGASELRFNVADIKSARCKTNPNIFAFNGYVEVDTIEEAGTINVPAGMLEIFEKEFPELTFVENNSPWEFIEYDGGYPALCGGDTIFKCGNIIIKTKIISHRCTKWKVEIPKCLEKCDIPSEIWEYENKETYCCGGCE